MSIKAIAHYEILEPLGEGGMGRVYRAVDSRLGRPVAVKLLRADSTVSEERRKRFIHEAKAASALNHPHIITIYDIGRDGDVDFMAMEYVAGPSLACILARGRLSVAESVAYAAEIADALAAAHAAGILHRDLKPANIMVTDRGSIKVLDFGLAKLIERVEGDRTDRLRHDRHRKRRQPLQTAEGTILGTAAYMSPEQAEGKPVDARSDIFSFGAVLYEMVAGRRAFRGDTGISTLAAVLTADPEPPSRLVHGLSPDLEKLIARCLRKNPERRWQSMADLKVALDDLREEADSSGLAEPSASPPARRVLRAVVGGLAIAGFGMVIAGVWQMTRTQPAAAPRPFLTRLTSDVGWTDYPSISLDGKFLAYASDRSGDGTLDIWVQQLPDGAPVRVTDHAADDVDPSFSADGSRIAFQSSRLGGGVYVVPTLGGDERLVAAGGFSPRFSPDGNWIAYGVAERGSGQIYVAPAAGGPATAVAADFYRAQSAVWSPDGRYLLFWGQRQRGTSPEGNVDWYVTAVARRITQRPWVRVRSCCKEGFQAFQGLPFPDAWERGGNRILFHGKVGDSSNIWQVGISPAKRRIIGTVQRATFGTTDEASAAVTSDGRMVFVSRTMGADIWSLPIDANRGKVQGELDHESPRMPLMITIPRCRATVRLSSTVRSEEAGSGCS